MPFPYLDYGDFPEAGHNKACFNPGSVTWLVLSCPCLCFLIVWPETSFGEEQVAEVVHTPTCLLGPAEDAVGPVSALPLSTSHPEAKESLRTRNPLCPTPLGPSPSTASGVQIQLRPGSTHLIHTRFLSSVAQPQPHVSAALPSSVVKYSCLFTGQSQKIGKRNSPGQI